jgi:hypothetical protein
LIAIVVAAAAEVLRTEAGKRVASMWARCKHVARARNTCASTAWGAHCTCAAHMRMRSLGTCASGVADAAAVSVNVR